MDSGSVQRITWRSADIVRVLTLLFLFLFAWRFFWTVYTAVLLVMLAVLIAIMIHAPARLLSRWIPFRVSFALVVVLFLSAVAGVFIAVIPQIVDQISELARQLPAAVTALSAWLEQTMDPGTEGTSDLPERINQQIGEFIGRFVPLAFNLIAVLFGMFAVLVLAIFLAAQPEVYRSMLLSVFAPGTREKVERIYDEAGRNLRLWVIGKAFTMLGVGIFTYVGLVFFEIPGALALAALAAVLEFIPNFGPTIAAAPAVISAFLISPMTALYVTIFYIVLQQIQSALTVPLVERRAVNIPSAALLAWQLMLALGFGLLALFVATPLLSVIVVTVRILYYEPAQEIYAMDRREEGLPSAPAPEATEVESGRTRPLSSPSTTP